MIYRTNDRADVESDEVRIPEEGDVTIYRVYRVWRVDLGETEGDAVEVHADDMRGAAIAYAERQDEGHPRIAMGETDVVVAVRRGEDEAWFHVDGEMVPHYRSTTRTPRPCTCGHDAATHLRYLSRCIAPYCACRRFERRAT